MASALLLLIHQGFHSCYIPCGKDLHKICDMLDMLHHVNTQSLEWYCNLVSFLPAQKFMGKTYSKFDQRVILELSQIPKNMKVVKPFRFPHLLAP